MSIVLTDEQVEFQKTVRSFLQSKVTEEDVRRLAADERGLDAELWQAFTELEFHTLAVPEENGGAGGSWVELGLLLEEMGAVLVSSPFFASTVLAAQALAELDPDAQRRAWIEQLRSGELTATLALPGRHGSYEPEVLSVRAVEAGAGWTLEGIQRQVIDGSTAGLILLAARTEEGYGLFAVERSEPELGAASVATLDPTRKMASVELSGVAAIPLTLETGQWPGSDRVLDLARIGLAAEQLGGARSCLEQAVAYAKDRFQHGQAIGSFQAIKHRCADIFLAIEAARSNVYHALSLAAEPGSSLDAAASVAKAATSEAFTQAATGSVQIHGGIGFSWEHPAHLYLKRAKSSEILLGTAADHRERLASCLAMH